MPDDLQIPSAPPVGRPSYRVDRPPAGLDPATRRLLAFAGGALALLLAAGGAWTVMARRPSGVPVIEADSRPLRVKPDNPGGMQVAGADEPDDAAPNLAPAPEAPAPLALRAQVQANRPPPAAAPALPNPGAATPGPAAAPAAPIAPAAPPQLAAGALPRAVPAAPAVSAPSPVPASVPAPGPRTATGTAQVQLAALDSEDAARTEWTRLQKKLPGLLAARQPAIQRAADKEGKTVWRVRTGGFADLADAATFCAKVRAEGAACSLATF